MSHKKKTVSQKKSWFQRIWSWVRCEKDSLNTIMTFFLIVVSLALILVTISSIRMSGDIRDITLLLEKNKQMDIIEDNIALAEDLKLEAKYNEDFLLLYLRELSDTKNMSESKIDVFHVDELTEADSRTYFGNENLSAVVKEQIIGFNLLKKQIVASQTLNSNNRNISIDKALTLCNYIYYGTNSIMNITSFQKILDDYIESENEKRLSLQKSVLNYLNSH